MVVYRLGPPGVFNHDWLTAIRNNEIEQQFVNWVSGRYSRWVTPTCFQLNWTDAVLNFSSHSPISCLGRPFVLAPSVGTFRRMQLLKFRAPVYLCLRR